MRKQKSKVGYFISFEGGEGSGKSTQIERLVVWLRARNFALHVTREPGGTRIGTSIRELLLHPDHRHLSARAEALLYQADRAQHVDEILIPALTGGKIVVCDRFFDSSLVYQGVGRGLGPKWIGQLSRFAAGGLVPDLTILLDVPTEVGLARLQSRGKAQDRLDLEGKAFHTKVRKTFLSLAKKEKKRFAVIDATQTADEVAAEIEALVTARLQRRKLWNPR